MEGGESGLELELGLGPSPRVFAALRLGTAAVARWHWRDVRDSCAAGAHRHSVVLVSNRVLHRRRQRPKSVLPLRHPARAVSLHCRRAARDCGGPQRRAVPARGHAFAAAGRCRGDRYRAAFRGEHVPVRSHHQSDGQSRRGRALVRQERSSRQFGADERIAVRIRAVHARAWVTKRGSGIGAGTFSSPTSTSGPASGSPDWILVQDSPLPNETQPVRDGIPRRRLRPRQELPAFSRESDHVFDQQDAFFVPFAGFRGVERPGPNYSLYKRISAP